MLTITIHEGRNRQIRKMCSAVGLPVRDLRRIRMGPIGLGRLKPGQWRDLTPDEVRRLKAIVQVDDPRPEKSAMMTRSIREGSVVCFVFL